MVGLFFLNILYSINILNLTFFETEFGFFSKQILTFFSHKLLETLAYMWEDQAVQRITVYTLYSI